jgi:hypothetical protein
MHIHYWVVFVEAEMKCWQYSSDLSQIIEDAHSSAKTSAAISSYPQPLSIDSPFTADALYIIVNRASYRYLFHLSYMVVSGGIQSINVYPPHANALMMPDIVNLFPCFYPPSSILHPPSSIL